MAAAKGKDTTSNCQQVESGAINQLTESRALPLTTKTEYTSPVHPSLVYCVPQLERVGGLYAALIKGHWIANVFAEMYFVVQLLTVNSAGHLSHPVTAKTSLTLFHNISDCVYFATFVLGYLTEAFSVLDDKTIALLATNSRVQLFKPSVADCLSTICKGKMMDVKANMKSVSLEFSKLPSANHIEHFRRQLFASDRSFHNFKKQRDVLYAVVRAWEGQWLNPDWTVEEQFGTTLRLMSNELYHHGILCQFTQLFVQLLLQLLSTEGPTVPKCLTHFPEEYKQLDSIKLKYLEERLVTPASQGGPCPPPSFPGFQSCFIDIILSARRLLTN
jgi:codanin-1